MSDDRFVLKDERGLAALPGWLKKRDYNGVSSGHQDRKGNPMIGLSWQRSSRNWDKRGLIIVLDNDLIDRAEEIAQQGAKRTK